MAQVLHANFSNLSVKYQCDISKNEEILASRVPTIRILWAQIEFRDLFFSICTAVLGRCDLPLIESLPEVSTMDEPHLSRVVCTVSMKSLLDYAMSVPRV